MGKNDHLSLPRRFSLAALVVAALAGSSGRAQTAPDTPAAEAPASIWETGIGEGFRKGAKEFDFGGGGGVGLRVLGSEGHHHWGLAAADYGWVFTEVLGKDKWYRGNWELMADLFGGYQFHPEGAYFVGVGPHLRYDFATGSRWVPFVDVGAGVSATDIREPDLSTTFEFNLQAGAGVHWFLRDNLAATFQWRFIHLSNAGIKYTNLGVNNSSFLVGLSWFF